MSQKEKYKYHILMHIDGISKAGTGDFIFRAAMEKQRTDLWSWGEGRREMVKMEGESNMESYITICKTDGQWEFAL